MKLIPLTQGLIAKIDDEDYYYINQWKWCAVKDGNTYYALRTTSKGETFRMHIEICNSNGIDHIDGDGLNNQKLNLRKANKSQNGANQKKNRVSSSIFKGVTFYKRTNKYMSRIGFNNKSITLGYYTDELTAAAIYDLAAIKYFGDFAQTNFPKKSVTNNGRN